MQKLPYGIADFELVRKNDFYFVDKTRYIKNIEDNANYLFFFRPRRFGKSLLCSMLECYYDIKRKDKFESLFGGLWIGENPTMERNSYMVLRLDFSKVAKEIDKVEDSFMKYLTMTVSNFMDYYSDYFTQKDIDFVNYAEGTNLMIDNVAMVCKRKKIPLYLIIDEYDNFTNAILFTKNHKDDYEKITHGTGFFRDFFQVCKPNFERIFMTGVSPVTYDDLTSGYNIGTNITMYPEFNGMLGFTETEVKTIIDYYRENGVIADETDKIIEIIKPWYDNCCFCESKYGKESVYNSNSVLSFLNKYMAQDGIPEELIDSNVRTDYMKLKSLVYAGHDVEVAYRMGLLERLLTEGVTDVRIIEQFPAERIGERETFMSMLFYYGVLSFGGTDEYGWPLMRVTNNCMRIQYLEYMQAMVSGFCPNIKMEEIGERIKDMALTGAWKGLIEILGEVYHEATTVRCSQMAERYAQAFFQGMIYLNPFYCVMPEVEMNHGYSDLFLFPSPTAKVRPRYSYIIELKFLHSGENEEKVESLIEDAKEQLMRYYNDAKTFAMAQGLPIKLVYIVVNAGEVLRYEEVETRNAN